MSKLHSENFNEIFKSKIFEKLIVNFNSKILFDFVFYPEIRIVRLNSGTTIVLKDVEFLDSN